MSDQQISQPAGPVAERPAPPEPAPNPEPTEKRYFRFLGNPRWYIWGLVAVLTIVAIYTTLAVQRNLWPFQIEKPIVTNPRPSPTASPSLILNTSSWQIYTNSQYEFKVNYPGYYSIQGSAKSGASASPVKSLVNLKSVKNDQLEIGLYSESLNGFVYIDQSASLEYKYDAITAKWVEIHGYDNKNEFAPKLFTSESGLKFYVVKTGDGGGSYEIAFVENPNKTYVLEFYTGRNTSYVDCVIPCPDKKPLSDGSTINQILSTFKFTN